MGSKASLIVGVAISLGTAVVCSALACSLPLEPCPGGIPENEPCDSSDSSTASGGGGGPAGPEIDGVLQRGAVLCSVCAASPFCYDSTQDPPVYVYITDPMDPCPTGFPAQRATRRSDGGNGWEEFYCIPPTAGDSFDVPGTWCPDDPMTEGSDLADYAYVDACADADEDCVPSECGEGGSGGGTGCVSENAEIVELCAKDAAHVGEPDEVYESAAAARQKIVDRAGTYHHPNVPGNVNADPDNPEEPPPDRYCFVTCFDEELINVPTSCDPADDPWVSTTSTFVAIDPESEATVTVHTTDEDGNTQAITSSVDIDGTMAIDVPRQCRGLAPGEAATCNAKIGSALLKGRSDLVVQGFTISDLSLINRAVWTASATAVGGTTTVSLNAAPALVTATVQPFGRFGARPELGGLSAVLDWNGRTYRSRAFFPSPSGNGDTTVLDLSGTIANIPPRADAGRDQTLECTGDGNAILTLTAAGSMDPDGAGDLAAFVWSREIDGVWVTSSGSTLTTPFRLGRTNVALTALDYARAKDTDGATITVVDTLPPDFDGVEVATGSLWPPNQRLHLFRLGQEIQPTVVDSCDSSPTVRIIDVAGEGDIRFGEEAVCVRAESDKPRQYTVNVEAVDASGNISRKDVVITNSDVAPEVADNDPRCP